MQVLSSEEFDRQVRRDKVLFVLCCAWLIAIAMIGCGTVPPTPTPGPSEYTCETYCAHALSMNCAFAQPAPGNNASCVEVCRAATSVVKWDLECRSTKETCERINNCERKGYGSLTGS